MLIKLDVMFTSLLALVPAAIFAYFLSEMIDVAGDHSVPLPENWQTIVEEAMEAADNEV